ncbi:MAG TPA: carboxypeptidase regulatory-like domain-containing protein [Candidatus Acidoferrales bacterium]|nr:carboxypeptidase regulatory-like domain-containing protein [Candidatus Acidoferrales bacterium]
MKHHLVILLGLLFAFSLRAQSNPTASDAAVTNKEACSVSGVVVRQDTGEPLIKAKVALVTHEKWEDSLFDLTDSQGHFLLDELPCRAYSLSASHPGFVEMSYGQRKPNDPGALLTLAPGQKMTGLVFKLQRTAVVTGRVFDENGESVRGALVRVLRATGHGKQQNTREAGTGATNDLGEYRIYDLIPGRYYMAVSYDPWSFREGFDAKPRRRLLKKGYPVMFYPNITDPSKALTLILNPGDELRAIDFRMELVTMNTVSGKILNPPAENAMRGTIGIYVVQRGSPLLGYNSIETRTLAKDGSFALNWVPPGSYSLRASYMDRDTKEWAWASRQLEVTDADAEGITLAFAPLIALRGRVIWEGSKKPDLSSFTVFLSPTDGESPNTRGQEVKPDGSFLFRAVNEGDYRPLIHNPDTNCYIKSARTGTTPMVDGKFAIHLGADNSLELLVGCRAAQVDGLVLTSDSLPATGVFVVLVPEPLFRQESSDYQDTRTDQNGHFFLKGIVPGDYELFSWDAVEWDDWRDADFLKPYEGKGVSIHLDEGDHKSIGLNLIETSANSQPKQ